MPAPIANGSAGHAPSGPGATPTDAAGNPVPDDPRRRFPLDPWVLREVGFDIRTLARAESLFALSNGHIGIRATVDEADPKGLPGSYLNSFYETRPLPSAEPGYGDPETGQTITNVTDGTVIRLLVDDEPLDIRYGVLEQHERRLDLRRGVLERELVWCSPAGKRVRLHSSRLVSFARRSIMAVRYRVEALDEPLRIVVQSELVANEAAPGPSKDPRSGASLQDVLVAEDHMVAGSRAVLVHRTRASGLTVAVAADHDVEAPGEYVTEHVARPDWTRMTVATRLEPGQTFRLDKTVAYGWSATRSVQTLRDQVDAALISADHAGWEQMEREQLDHLTTFWQGADVELEGAEDLQRAVRFGIFHAHQASERAEGRCIPAKGLTGPGYDGHAFWDTEMFVLPMLTATSPAAAAAALGWRLRTMDQACSRAETLRLRGATFPWRTISGPECSGYWPAGTAALHVNADVAAAAARHVRWTDDREFEKSVALPLLVETARLWAGFGYVGDDDRFHIDGVTGPDEYTAVVDDNVYTNLMAKQNLQNAADSAERHAQAAAALEVGADEIARWRDYAGRMAVPFDDELGVHEQDRGFTRRAVWDFERSERDDEYPLLLHAPYFELYRTQVVKQADLVLAMHWAGHEFTVREKARNFAYYDAITVRDSSLSACTQAVLAAEVGHLDLAADYLTEAVLLDIYSLNQSGGDGLHLASLAGGWIALVAGFGGLRDHGDRLTFRPQLPPGWTRLRFALRLRDRLLRVDIGPTTVRYSVDDPPESDDEQAADPSATVMIRHLSDGRADAAETDDDAAVDVEVTPEGVELPWVAVEPITPRPTQPAGRGPFVSVGERTTPMPTTQDQ